MVVWKNFGTLVAQTHKSGLRAFAVPGRTAAPIFLRSQGAPRREDGFLAAARSLCVRQSLLRSRYQAGKRLHQTKKEKPQPVSRRVSQHKRALRNSDNRGG